VSFDGYLMPIKKKTRPPPDCGTSNGLKSSSRCSVPRWSSMRRTLPRAARTVYCRIKPLGEIKGDPHAGQFIDRYVALIGALAIAGDGCRGQDEGKYPDWGGQWLRPRGIGIQWDQDKASRPPQQAPLKPEYQRKLEASMADQQNGGQGLDNRFTCMTNGMPRMMAVIGPIEFVILPAITYIHFEAFMPRRIYTDGAISQRTKSRASPAISIGKCFFLSR